MAKPTLPCLKQVIILEVTHTVDVTLPTAQGLQTHGVDTGFLVYNERTYPGLIGLFKQLQVPTVKSE